MRAQNNSRIGSLLQYTGLVFCFFVFPFFIFYSSLGSLFELRLENHRHQVFQQLSDHLKQLTPFNDERRYYHLLLQKTFELAKQQADPVSYLEKAIARLKQRHPQRLEFIVWDKSGNVVERLTDEKRFRFVIRRLYEVLRSVTNHVTTGGSEKIKDLDIVKSNLNLIRQFLGRVFLPDTLNQPYLDDENSSLILADYGKNRPYFWYHTDPAVSMLCFVSWEAINDDQGLRSIVNAVNLGNDSIVTGFASLHELDQPFMGRHQHIKNEVVMALARYENSSEQMIESRSAQIVVQLLNPHTRIFALSMKDEDIYNPDQMRVLVVTRAILIYLLIGLLVYFNFRVRRAFFSIRWKLLLLFLYANVAPLTVLGAIAYDYLQNRKVSLRNEIQLESARLLRDIDNRFKIQSKEFTQRLNTLLDRINQENGNRMLDDKEIEKIAVSLQAFSPSEAFLIDRNGRMNFAFGSGGRNISHSTSYVKNIADAMLKYHNRIITVADKSDMLSKIADPEHSDFVRNSIRDSSKIWPMSVGDSMKMGYWNMLGDKQNYQNNYFLLLMWDEDVFQRLFLDQYFSSMKRTGLLAGTFARTVNSNEVIPAAAGDSAELVSFLKTVAHSSGNIYASLRLASQECLATGWRGKNMNYTCFAVVYPTSDIESEIASIIHRLLTGAFLSIMLTIIIAMAVARQFLEPVKALSDAATAVSRHDYRYRINIPDKDEFGHLGQTMNSMIEGLGELEIAKIVQESLFPERQPVFKPFSIYGQSVVMTTLAGDYFDFVEIGNDGLGIMIGDVAGHGISAALIMAMAKAGVKMASEEEKLDTCRFTAELHRIVCSLKTGRLKRMMTFQYLVLDRHSANIRVTNAGHCYPLLVDSGQQRTEYLEIPGTPLGAGKLPHYQSVSMQLQPGQALILYTDGVAEAHAASGQVMGYERFARLALLNYSDDAKTFYRRIYNACLEWSGNESNDDLTMILLVYPRNRSGSSQ